MKIGGETQIGIAIYSCMRNAERKKTQRKIAFVLGIYFYTPHFGGLYRVS